MSKRTPREEINRRYTEHLDSLDMSGFEYDRDGIIAAWLAELAELED